MATEAILSEVKSSITKAQSVVDNHRSDLTKVQGLKPQFDAAAKGASGTAIQRALDEALEKGRNLTQRLENTGVELNKAKDELEGRDQESGASIPVVPDAPAPVSATIDTSQITAR
ncbi:hypothetical protein JK358_35785 [Nocardia sp. 2]|uniref:Uncharacterized protein n=1 Tax=Nocardia acididurans TaxID=2802282 RepID=A0ABS1MGT4_9NOCA|nr:hypothetical protein [Nocardia acididurans]MBL1079777.1 hypothetical protein [Nocardia acididurans]